MDFIQGIMTGIGDMLSGGNLTALYAGAFILGAAHALEPGHGKTVVAAYLVGSRGKVYEAALLGLIVTFTHTFSIIVLAVITKYAASSFSDRELHTYLGFVAAILIIGVGAAMMFARWRVIHRLRHHHDHDHDDHGHEHGHEHDHHDHGHEHEHEHGFIKHTHHKPAAGEALGFWKLFALGVSGGLVPCPAAFALLLAAVSVGALAKGLGIVLVFSLGLAMTLIAIGIGVVKAAGFAGRFMDTERFAPYVAMASAALVTLIGVVTLLNAIRDLRLMG